MLSNLLPTLGRSCFPCSARVPPISPSPSSLSITLATHPSKRTPQRTSSLSLALNLSLSLFLYSYSLFCFPSGWERALNLSLTRVRDFSPLDWFSGGDLVGSRQLPVRSFVFRCSRDLVAHPTPSHVHRISRLRYSWFQKPLSRSGSIRFLFRTKPPSVRACV